MIDFAIMALNYILGLVQGFLSLTPQQFDMQMWTKASDIQSALIPASQTVLVICFTASVYSEHLAEVNRNTVFRLTLRFALAELLMNGCGALVQAIAIFGNWILSRFTGGDMSTSILFTIPPEVKTILDTKYWDIFNMGPMAVVRFIFELLFMIVVIGCAVVILMSVIVRFFRLFIGIAVAPVPLAFAGAGSGNDMSRVASRFVSGLISLSIQCVVIWIVFALFAMVLKGNVLDLLPLDNPTFLLYAWMINTIIHLLLLVSLVRGADRLVSQLGFSS